MKQLTNSIWVLEGPTNIGFIVNDSQVTLIDSGNDKESGRKINKILKEKNWTLKRILNTHSNADHIGGNDYLQRNLNCEIYSPKIENVFVESPSLETAFLWGGMEVKELRNKFFHAKPSKVSRVLEDGEEIEGGIKAVCLKGHYFNMTGFLCDERVFFLGDSIFGENILRKYKIPFVFDVDSYKKSIQTIIETDTDYYIPSHGNIVSDIQEMANENLRLIDEIEEKLLGIVNTEKQYEQILKEICDSYQIDLNIGQIALIGSTIRSFLSWLYDEDKITYEIKDNLMLWKRKN